jgi:D-glycero-D-manno-heptose 1,7-bisphosphate phosphatase
MSRRFVLVDRDGTINEEAGYVLEPDQVRLIPGSAGALRELRDLGLGLVVVTNQSPLGRGWLTEEGLTRIHTRLEQLLSAEDSGVKGFEVCPHTPDDGCGCRKPAPGMVLRAAAAYGFDPAEAFVVGDHRSDVEMGRRVGARTILVRTGHGEEELAKGAGALADHVVADLKEAAGVIRDEVLAEARP